MRLIIYSIITGLALCLALVDCAPAAAQPTDTASPEMLVNQFYRYHFAHDMGFTPDAIKERSRWLTPEMLEACKSYFAMPQNPDEPPLINGDPFTNTQEYPGVFAVGVAELSENSAHVPVTFSWTEVTHATKAVVVLKEIEGKWLIDDIQFPDQESMRDLLEQ